MEWQQNKLAPWEMKATMATDKIQAGRENMGGFGSALSGLSDFAGTAYYNSMLKQLMGGGQATVGGGGNSFKSSPLQVNTPQQNLNNTLAELLRKVKINQPQGLGQ